MSPCIALKNIAVVAQGRALLDITDLQIGAGERIAIVGSNGAGKTTLLRLLSGFVPPSYGSPVVLGHSLHKTMRASALRQLRAGVGQVMQGLHLVGRLSAQDNVLIGCLARVQGWRSWTRWYAPADITLAQAALHAVGMLARAQTRTDTLSGGERQKVAIARLLMQRPQLILADEPTAALDPAAALEVCKLLVKAAGSATLITVVHNPALIPLLAERVIGLKQGQVAFDLHVDALDDQRLTDLYRATPLEPSTHWQVDASTPSTSSHTSPP